MKLLLFILGLSLCAALPGNDFSDYVIQSSSDEEVGDYHAPRWLLEDVHDSAEETLPAQPEEEQNGEENLPGSDEEEEEDILSGIREDQELNLVFDYGVEGVIAAGIKKSKIPNKNFTVTSVSSYSSITSGNQERHQFSVEAISDDKRSVINMNFTVSYHLNTHNITLFGYSYIIKTTTPKPNPSDSYVSLTPAEIESGEGREMMYFGVSQVIRRGIQQNKFPGSNYDVTKVVSAVKQVQKTRTLYKFNVEFEDANKVHVNAQFTVMIKPSTQEKFLMSYAYQASGMKFTIDESAYIKVSKAEIRNNRELNECLDLAIEEAIKQSEEYSISQINAVYIQVLKGIEYYKFDVELTNHKNKTVKLVATVAYDSENDVKDVKAYETKTITVGK